MKVYSEILFYQKIKCKAWEPDLLETRDSTWKLNALTELLTCIDASILLQIKKLKLQADN